MNKAPIFIREKIQQGKISGSFEGAVLLADICGFTSRFDQMAGLGAKGAELISSEVSNTFTEVVNICADFGGFPVSFAGDAVTVVFPGKTNKARNACEQISLLNSESILPLKNSIGRGRIVWDVVPLQGWTFYSIQGTAVREATKLNSDNTLEQSVLSHEEDMVNSLSSNIVLPVDSFNPPSLFSSNSTNEFRQVINIFLSLENRIGYNCPRSFQELILEVATELGGFVSGLEADHVLVVFGAPVSREDDPRRADAFLQQIFARANGRVKAGATSGLVFSGLIKTPLLESYTVLGPSVNLAARLHSSAGWNSIYSDPGFNRSSCLGFKSERQINLKGIKHPVQVSLLSPWVKREKVADQVPPLFERDNMLDRIEKELKNRNSCILINGIAGLGKTRLANELISRMTGTFFITFRSESSSGGNVDIFSRWLGEWMGFDAADKGLSAFRERLYSFIDLLDELSDPDAAMASNELLRAESVLAAMVGLQWERSLFAGLDPKGRFRNTVSVIAAFIQGFCLLQKTILIFDDLQWMNRDSITLLAAVLGELGENTPPILLLTRPGLEGIVHDLSLTPQEIKMKPLSRLGCKSFLNWSLSEEPEDELLDWFYGRTEGIPFFMEQYALMLSSNAVPLDEDSFPGNLHGLLVARLDRLDFEIKESVLIASILGRIFDPKLLQLLVPHMDIEPILHGAVAERIWEPVADGSYSFIHILLQEAAYNLQLHSEREKIHTRVAENMKDMWALLPEKAQSIAYHLERADRKQDAAIWFIKAGRYSLSRNYTTACLEQMKKVLQLSNDISNRLDAHKVIYDLHSLTGSWQKAEDVISLATAENLTIREMARVQMMRVNMATNMGKPQEALELLEGIKESDPGLKPQILIHRGRILMLQAKTEEAMNFLLNVYEELKEGTHEEKLLGIKALGNASGCMLRLNRRAEAEKSLKQVLAFAVETGNLVLETLAIGNLALAYKYLAGRQNDAILMTRKHLELARRTGSRLLELQAVGNLGSLLEREESSTEVFVLLENAVELARKYGGNEALSISLGNLGRALERVGKSEQALKLYRDAIQICEEERMQVHKVDFAFEIAHILMETGLLNQAEDQIRQIDEWRGKDGELYSILWCESKLLRLQGRKQEAVKILKKGLEQFADSENKFDLLYELYMSGGDIKTLRDCIEQGEELYAKNPHWDFKNKLDELVCILKNK